MEHQTPEQCLVGWPDFFVIPAWSGYVQYSGFQINRVSINKRSEQKY